MGVFSFLSTRDASRFADELAESLTRDLPPKLMLKSSSVVSANRVTTLRIDALLQMAANGGGWASGARFGKRVGASLY